MSQLLVNAFLADLDRLKKMSGVLNEQTIRPAFRQLLRDWSRADNLVFVEELEFATSQKTKVYPDGTVLHDLRVPLGFWEAKDTKDDLDTEISKKLRSGYPQTNILFENSQTAILIQNREEVTRCDMTDTDALEKLLKLFFSYERPEIAEFRKAIEQFKADLPHVLDALRARIDEAYDTNDDFREAADAFLAQAKRTINPAVAEADIREMLIQHILTEEIFSHVFNDGDFHRENNIAKALYGLEERFFSGAIKRETLKALQPYYAAIRANAAQITAHSEKQTFLKIIYENFYKVYNPKAADRLGVVYTPNEIVRFMIDGADWLCQKHFGRSLIDRNVEILDPATGTGTFICELLEHFRGQPEKLAHKYKNELHANEVAILPYYVANLNIEATYAAISGQFAEYPNLCFVDTLDNVAALGIRSGHQHEMFGAMSDENVERIKRQNARKISVVIGNPPYNAWQENFNSRNPNRAYKRIDETIKNTYVLKGTAQNKNSVYDMYTRFFRWATDRLHDDGIVTFITNRNYIEKAAFDGFRQVVSEEFAEIYVMDLGGDVRANPKLSGTTHNVFGIQTGVSIAFCVRKKGKFGALIRYARRPEMERAEDKLAFLSNVRLSKLDMQTITPSKRHAWIDQTDNDWDELLPLCVKKAKRLRTSKALFELMSNGVKTQRDEWVFASSEKEVVPKAKFLIEVYERVRGGDSEVDRDSIKWDRELGKYLTRGVAKKFDESSIVTAAFRPFVRRSLYFDRHLNAMTYQLRDMFPTEKENQAIAFLGIASSHEISVISVDTVPDLGLLKQGNGGTQCVSRYRYTPSGEQVDNITDWGLRQFKAHYGTNRKKPITKDAIFHYVYGVLHDPVYRETYAINLKRDFPRVPFYPDFWQWADWGQRLMDMHINYESVEPWPLERLDAPDEKAREAGVAPKTMLKADTDNGIIRLDSETTLSGVPAAAWDYRLGNRSALHWILDQYKEKKPRDPTIREKFNTYRFADYKEQVVDLLMRVTRVSVETVEIVEAMRAAKRD
jgi:predicted helicase